MKKIKRTWLFFILLSAATSWAKTHNVVISSMVLSNSIGKTTNHSMFPGRLVTTISNTDEIIYYSADVGILNPGKEKYSFKIVCMDSTKHVIYEDNQDLILNGITRIGEDNFAHSRVYLRLDPEPGSFVDGRLLTWENNKDYFIKLYLEKKLIGITYFHYVLKKNGIK